MEQEGEKPKSNNVLGHGKRILTAGILLGSSIFSRGNASADIPQSQVTDSDSSYTQEANTIEKHLPYKVVVPGIAADQSKISGVIGAERHDSDGNKIFETTEDTNTEVTSE